MLDFDPGINAGLDEDFGLKEGKDLPGSGQQWNR